MLNPELDESIPLMNRYLDVKETQGKLVGLENSFVFLH